MREPDARSEPEVRTPEQLIGEFLVGFVGDPEQLADEDKWRLYDALLEAGNLLGEVVAEAWLHGSLANQDTSSIESAEESRTRSHKGDSAPGDRSASS